MNINYYNPYVRAELELYHHGVAGQKWGKRNGPPYPLGRSQVSSSERKAGWKESKWASGGNGATSSSVSNKKKTPEDNIKEAKLWTETDCKNATSKEDKRRNREAADLGLKALNKIGRDSAEDINNITNDDRAWFVYEDQTIGLFTIADLVNRGISKSKILSLINDARKIEGDARYSKGVFQLSEAFGADEFIDACIDIKRKS